MSSVSLHLLVASHRTKHNLREALTWKHSEADSPDGSTIFDQGQCLVLGVKHQPGDVLLGHPRQLMGEHILKGDQPEHRLLGHLVSQTVSDAVEADHSLPLLYLGRLIPGRVLREHGLGPQHLVLILDTCHDLRHCLLQTLLLITFPLSILMILVKQVSRPLLTPGAPVTAGRVHMRRRILFKLWIPDWGMVGVNLLLKLRKEPWEMC